MQKQYPFSAYDKNLSLKLNPITWLITAFLMRPYVIMVLSFANKQDRIGLLNLFYHDRTAIALGALASLPAIGFVYALANRTPDASQLVRKLWHRSRELLAASAVLGIIEVFLPLVMGKIKTLGNFSLLWIAIYVMIIIYLYASQRVKDTFNDFPQPVDKADK